MKQKLHILIAILIMAFSVNAQVKIGDNPNLINPNSILELESSNKVLVISRLTTAQMNAIINPVRGSLLYNIDEKCVYTHNESSWVSLCGNTQNLTITNGNIAPTTPKLGDYWVNSNTTSIWNGSDWVVISRSPIVGSAVPSSSTVTNANAGDIYVNSTTGDLYTYNGTTWIPQGGSINGADNGVSLDSSTKNIQLGGVLTKPTTITTTASNTLSIEGITEGDIATDNIVTVDKTTGQLKQVQSSALLKEEVTKIKAKENFQLVFDEGFTLRSTDKINVYRNGVRIDFKVNSDTKITLEDDAKCYIGDEIRIVQFY